jgi:DNA-binding LacI/PurR family transcriptional regulator
MKQVTIKEVARLAGSSPATVSRVLNASGPVAGSTRSRVESVMATLGYVPMFAARQMRGKAHAHTVAIIAHDFTNMYFHQLLGEMEPMFREAGMTFLVASVSGQEGTLADLVRSLKRRGVEGLIMSPLESAGDFSTELRVELAGYPVVLLDQTDSVRPLCTVRSDGCAALRDATRYLIESGHRAVGCIGPSLDIGSGQDRILGYRQALADAALRAPEEWVFRTSYTYFGGQEAGESFLALKRRPTAVAAASDLMAIGFMSAVMAAGVRVPDDLSVIGYDNIWLGEAFLPSLTTVAQDVPAMARAAIGALHALLNGETPGSVVLPTRMIVRESARRLGRRRICT